MVRANGLNSIAQQAVYVNANTGSNTSGNGSAMNPWATITNALSAISDNTITKPYAIYFTGASTENVSLKPFISIFGSGVSTAVITGNITADASWDTVSGATSTVSDVAFTNLSFDVHTFTGTANLRVSNCSLSGTSAVTGKDNSDTLYLSNNIFSSTFAITDISTRSFDNDILGAITYTGTNIAGTTTWFSFGDIIRGTFSGVNTSGSILNYDPFGCRIASTASLDKTVWASDADSVPQSGFTFSNAGSASYSYCVPNKTFVTPVTGATYTILKSDYILACNRAGAIALTLPSSPGTGLRYIIKDTSGAAAANNITITPAAGNIDGAASYVINTNYGSISTFYNGTEWSIY